MRGGPWRAHLCQALAFFVLGLSGFSICEAAPLCFAPHATILHGTRIALFTERILGRCSLKEDSRRCGHDLRRGWQSVTEYRRRTKIWSLSLAGGDILNPESELLPGGLVPSQVMDEWLIEVWKGREGHCAGEEEEAMVAEVSGE